MPYRITMPHPDSFIARNTAFNADLYAELADVPLYANARIISPRLVGRRSSFRLGWVIDQHRMAKGRDSFTLPEELLAWVSEQMKAAFPSVREAAGLSDNETKELEAEQAEKRKKYEKPK